MEPPVFQDAGGFAAGPPGGMHFQPQGSMMPQQPLDQNIASKIAQLEGRVLLGVLKRWNNERGFGHIECQETNQMFGKDMFVLKSSFVGVGLMPENLVNQKLCFSVFAGRSGAEARNIYLADGPPPGAPGGPPLMSPPDMGPPGMGLPGEKWFTGTVKNYNIEKGWGHIGCEETQREFNRDVFVSRNTIGNGQLYAGDRVRFTVRVQEKGPATEKVEVINGQPASMVPDNAELQAAAAAAQAGLGFGPPPGQPGAIGISDQTPGVPVSAQNTRYIGLVKTFDDIKGWGHIECEASRQVYGKDIFLLRSACNGLPVTAHNQIEFSVMMSPKGPQARDVCLVDFGPDLVIMQREVRSAPY